MILCPEGANTRMKLGMWGEFIVRRELENAGYTVRKQPKLKGGDLLAAGLKIEVKAAHEDRSGAYWYCLTKNDKWGRTDHEQADVLILIAVNPSGFASTFVIPAEALAGMTNLRITRGRGYRGKYAEYKKPILTGLRRYLASN